MYFSNGNKTVFENFSKFSIGHYSMATQGILTFNYYNSELKLQAYATVRTDTIRYYLVSDLESLNPASDDPVSALVEPPIMVAHLFNVEGDNKNLQVCFQNGSVKTFQDLQLCGYVPGGITTKDALVFTYNKGTCLGNIYLDEVNYYLEIQKD